MIGAAPRSQLQTGPTRTTRAWSSGTHWWCRYLAATPCLSTLSQSRTLVAHFRIRYGTKCCAIRVPMNCVTGSEWTCQLNTAAPDHCRQLSVASPRTSAARIRYAIAHRYTKPRHKGGVVRIGEIGFSQPGDLGVTSCLPRNQQTAVACNVGYSGE